MLKDLRKSPQVACNEVTDQAVTKEKSPKRISWTPPGKPSRRKPPHATDVLNRLNSGETLMAHFVWRLWVLAAVGSLAGCGHGLTLTALSSVRACRSGLSGS